MRKKIHNKVLRRFVAIILILVLVGIACESGLLIAIEVCARKERPVEQSDVLIVLGARVWPSGEPSDALKYRLDAALDAYGKGLAGHLIVCGGQGDDEPQAEAVVMENYLVQNGIPAEKILVEDSSVNTIQNLKNARVLMDSNGFQTAIIVTSDYHMERALYLADRAADIQAWGISAESPAKLITVISNRFRESLSWIYYFVVFRP